MTSASFRKTMVPFLVAVSALPLLSGCAPTLQPAAGADLAPGGGAVASAGGVQMVTMTPDFPGIVDIESAVTPVKVNITNNGRNTVLIRYSDFKLVGEDGTAYPALPLYKIDTSVSTPTSNLYNPINAPGFYHRGFRVAPFYRGIYPGLPYYGGQFRYGGFGWNGYDSLFWDGFSQVKLPTPAMYQNVLPEGVLDPGGSLQGWLYFKHVKPQQGEALSFDASLMSVQGATLGTISIPYTFAK